MRAFLTILLLLCSNVVMTFAWYGNLKLKEMNPDKDWPLYLVILCSWGLALFEYCFMIPANRIGSDDASFVLIRTASSPTFIFLICISK